MGVSIIEAKNGFVNTVITETVSKDLRNEMMMKNNKKGETTATAFL